MAIMQERYVRITSTNVGSSAIQERDLNGLLFTLGRGWIGEGVFGTDAILKCYSVDQVRKYFSSSSDEVKFAQKYFAYISPSGSTPASLSFARVMVTDNDPDGGAYMVLSYAYGVIGAEEKFGWFSPSTKGNVSILVKGKPSANGHLYLTIKDPSSASAGTTVDYTFVSGVYTAKNQIMIGETPSDTATNIAAVINGNGGFYGQSASAYVSADVHGDTVVLTAVKAGADNSPNVSFDVPDETEFQVSGVPGGDGGTGYVSPFFEKPAEALSRVNILSNNFGSFAILDGDKTAAGWTNSDIKELLVQNAGYNYKYLASVLVKPVSDDDTTNEVSFVTEVGYVNGASVERGGGDTTQAIPMAIFGAIDYAGTNTAPNFMFKQISGEDPSVFSDSVADTLDGIHVNYYGQTQVNGRHLSFYQRGFNLDGEDTAVYCNEVWLKSHIATAIFNLLVSVERVPANEDGESMIYTTIAGAAQQAVTNGTIEPGKRLSAAQIAQVYQLTGDTEAYMTIQNAGYWLDVVIEQDGTEYKAVYKLVYGKGDSIRKVEGSDILM